MVDQTASIRALDPVSRVFHALADPTRRSILERLASSGAQSISALAEPFAISLQGVSKHLKVLERAGLISRDVDGRVHRCSLDAAPMARASDWMEQYRPFWEGTLDALSSYIDTLDESGNERSPSRTDPDSDSAGDGPKETDS